MEKIHIQLNRFINYALPFAQTAIIKSLSAEPLNNRTYACNKKYKKIKSLNV